MEIKIKIQDTSYQLIHHSMNAVDFKYFIELCGIQKFNIQESNEIIPPHSNKGHLANMLAFYSIPFQEDPLSAKLHFHCMPYHIG